jgi:hypothetical protein
MGEELEIEPQSADKKKRTQGRRLPRLTLKNTVELVKAVHDLGGGDPVPRDYALDHIHKNPNSSGSRTLIATTVEYGLIDSNDGKLQLTQLGQQFLEANPNSSQQLHAALDALYLNEYFAAFMTRYEGKALSSDKAAPLYFKQNHSFSEQMLKRFGK